MSTRTRSGRARAPARGPPRRFRPSGRGSPGREDLRAGLPHDLLVSITRIVSGGPGFGAPGGCSMLITGGDLRKAFAREDPSPTRTPRVSAAPRAYWARTAALPPIRQASALGVKRFNIVIEDILIAHLAFQLARILFCRHDDGKRPIHRLEDATAGPTGCRSAHVHDGGDVRRFLSDLTASTIRVQKSMAKSSLPKIRSISA